MGLQRTMQRFARWHIWLGWLVGVPLVMWTLSGLVMVIRPLEEVRGSDRLIEAKQQPLPKDSEIAVTLPAAGGEPVVSVTAQIERGRVVTRLGFADGSSVRFGEDGRPLASLTEAEARQVVRQGVRGGGDQAGAKLFLAKDSPGEFRKDVAAWQVTLGDGTHVYVGADSGTIEAIRTPFWRFYDFMWGLHIMDLQTREDTHNPFIIAFAVLALAGSLLGCILMFRRRKARARV